jgi:hypothetical protein
MLNSSHRLAEEKTRVNRANALFETGQVIMSSETLDVCAQRGLSLDDYIARHSKGDWGDVESSQWKANDRALEDGGQILSMHILEDGAQLFIVTAPDRKTTTISVE